jgi:ubiquinone/menaquinone biosynthesis C-methylase UbiE
VDHPAVWPEFARVLAPGGRLVLVDEDFDDATHPSHKKHAGHEAEMTPVDVAVIVAAMAEVGLEATGEHTTVAGVPAKVIRAVRVA